MLGSQFQIVIHHIGEVTIAEVWQICSHHINDQDRRVWACLLITFSLSTQHSQDLLFTERYNSSEQIFLSQDLVRASIVMTKHNYQKASWGRRGLFGFHFHIVIHHHRMQGRNWNRTGTDVEVMEECFLQACSVCFPIMSRTTIPGVTPPSHIGHYLRKCLTPWSHRAISLTEAPLWLMTLACVNLKHKAAIIIKIIPHRHVHSPTWSRHSESFL